MGIGVWKAGGTIVNEQHTMYIYGRSAGKHSSTDTNQFWEFDIPHLSQWWREDNITDIHNAPYIRSHCMVSYDETIIIFGGKGNHGKVESTIRFLDSKHPETGFVKHRFDPSADVPMPRHAMTCQMMQIGDQYQMVMFGGRHQWTEKGEPKVRYFNDLWTFDVNDKEWTQIKSDGTSTGPWPIAVAHASSVVHDGTHFVLSGEHTENEVVSDNWMFDLSIDRWTKLPDFPKGRERCEHVAVEIAGQGMIVFGGQKNLPGFEEVMGHNELLNDVLLCRIGDVEGHWEMLQENQC